MVVWELKNLAATNAWIKTAFKGQPQGIAFL